MNIIKSIDEQIARLHEMREYLVAEQKAASGAENTKPGDDGWIEWNGGECPVNSDVLVEVKYRGYTATWNLPLHPGMLYWSSNNSPTDIIAYRIAGAQT